ncbi:MAG: DUF2079 domain-containing protein, partial [Chloroflexi bacterium]|nr:DUF2079 domain-containing protein [Chloroflexota bacterium]
EAALLAAGIAAWGMLRAFQNVRSQRNPDADATSPPASSPIRLLKTTLRSQDFLVPFGILLIALAWFIIATFVIVPAHAVEVYGADQSLYFHRYGPLGDTPLDIFTSFFTRPEQVWAIASEPARLRYLFGLFFAFGFLPLLGFEVILVTLPLLLANLLSTYPAQYYGEFHYSAPLIPFFAFAAFVALRRLRRLWRGAVPWATILLLAAALIFYGEAGRGPLGKRYDPTPITAHHRLLQRFVAQLPPDAAVTATAAIHPHISHRRYAYKFPFGLDADRPADWALIDVTTDTDMAPGDVKSTVEDMLAGAWGVVDAADGYLLLQRGAPSKIIPPAFYDFARTSGQPTANNPLTFVDISWQDWRRWRQTQVITRWQVGADYVPGSIRPWLEIRNLAGERVYTDADLTPPALLWYPPDQWQPGDRLIITTLPLFLPRTWGAVIAAVHGPDPFLPQHRLPRDLFLSERTALTSPDRTLALVAIVQRDKKDRLQALKPSDFPQHEIEAANTRPTTARFRGSNGEILAAQVSLPTKARAGTTINIFSQWLRPLPEGVVLFVHLRQNGTLISQSDGPLQVFIPLDTNAALWDWRQLTIPEDIDTTVPLELVLGLYRLADGERLEALTSDDEVLGNELSLGKITLLPPPIPDQTCALIPATCASQRIRY